MIEEVWKDILGYEGRYQISTFGRVKHLAGIDVVYSTRYQKYYQVNRPERILKNRQPGKCCKYESITLRETDGSLTGYLIHRLVAQTFIPNPNNLPEVNHKDEDKLNNHVDNLEWCTHKYNSNYGTRNKRAGENRKGKYCGPNNSRYGKPLPKEIRQQISDTLKEYNRQIGGSPRKGTHVTEEQLENIRQGALRGWEKRKKNNTTGRFRPYYKYMRKGDVIKQVRLEDIDKYLADGYHLGRKEEE